MSWWAPTSKTIKDVIPPGSSISLGQREEELKKWKELQEKKVLGLEYTPSTYWRQWRRYSRQGLKVDCSTPGTRAVSGRGIFSSNVANTVWENIQDTAAGSPIPIPELLATGDFGKVLVDGRQIFNAFRGLLSQATSEVLIATFVWDDGSDAARRIGEGLKKAERRVKRSGGRLRVKILVDEITWNRWKGSPRCHDVCASVNRWNLDPNVVDIETANYAHTGLGSLHSKYTIADGKTMILTGANVQAVHNFSTPGRAPWHDTGVVLGGPVAAQARLVFQEAWTHAVHYACTEETCTYRDSRVPSFPNLPYPTLGDSRMILLPKKGVGYPNSALDNPQDQGWLAAINTARTNVNVQSPNINDPHFLNAIACASRRGVKVRLLTAYGFNEGFESTPLAGGSNLEVLESFFAAVPADDRRGLSVRVLGSARPTESSVRRHGLFLVGNLQGVTHTKYMTVDGEVAIVGSGNQDKQSWHHSRELNVLIDDADAVAKLEAAVFVPDWKRSIPVTV